MTISGSHYVWTCSVSDKVIIKQDAMHVTNPKYETKAGRRLDELKVALEKHSHGKHR